MRFLENALLTASVMRVMNDVWAALRIGLLPFVVVFIALAILNTVLFGTTGGAPLAFVLTLIIGVLTLAYSTVSWHRFVLGRGTEKGLRPVLIYALMWVVLVCALAVAAIVLSFLVALPLVLVLGAENPDTPAQVDYIAGILILIGAIYLFLRLSPVLVAIAVGDRRTTSAWKQTSAMHRSVAGFSTFMSVALVLFELAEVSFLSDSVVMVLSIASAWLAFMWSLSVMTELYRMTNPEDAPIDEIFS